VVHLMWNSPESLLGPDTPQENLLDQIRWHRNYASLSYLSLCPLCPLWFNHSDTTGIDIICEAGKPLANRQENSLFVEQAGKFVAEGRGGHATIKFTQDVNSKVRSPF